MKSIHSNKLNFNNLIIIFLIPIIFLSTFNSNSKTLSGVGLFSMLAVLFISLFLICVHYFKSKEMHKIQFNFFILVILFLLVLLIGTLFNPSGRALITLFQAFAILSFFMFCNLILWNDCNISIAKNLSILFLLLPFFSDIRFVGAQVTIVIFFLFLQNKKILINLLLLLASFYIIYLSGMRSVFVLLIVSLITYIFWKPISKSYFRYISFFTLVILSIVSFVLIYPNLYKWSKFYEINQFVYYYTGKQILSGRDEIWINLVELIKEKPLLGYGTGASPGAMLDLSLSAHNLYLQIAFQNGLIGLSILLALLLLVWKTYYKTKALRSTRLSASFFIGIIVYQTFEVVLLQNKLDTALIFWLIISVGISNTINTFKKPSLKS